MALGLIAAAGMTAGVGGATAGTILATQALAIGAAGIGALQAIQKGKFEARVASFAAKKELIKGKIKHNEDRITVLKARQQSNLANSAAIVARNTKGTIAFAGDSGDAALAGIRSTQKFNVQMADTSAELGLASSQSRAASIKQRGRDAKRQSRGAVVTSLLGIR